MINQMKTKFQRTCMGCYEQKDKFQLIRIVKNKKEEIYVDKSGKAEGRGIYICKDINCLNSAIKSKKISKLFNINISEDLFDSIRGVIIEEENKNN